MSVKSSTKKSLQKITSGKEERNSRNQEIERVEEREEREIVHMSVNSRTKKRL